MQDEDEGKDGSGSVSDGEYGEKNPYNWSSEDGEELQLEDEQPLQPAAAAIGAGPAPPEEPRPYGDGLTESTGWTNRSTPHARVTLTDGTVVGGRYPGAADIEPCAPRYSLALIARVRLGLDELREQRLVEVAGFVGAQGHVLSLNASKHTARVRLWSGDVELYAAVWTRRGLSALPCRRVRCPMAGSRSRSCRATAYR